MGKPKQEKTEKERLSEGVFLLTQLRDAGVRGNGMGFQLLKTQISEWVSSGIPWYGTISFPEHGRIAEVELPRYNNKTAEIHLKVKATY